MSTSAVIVLAVIVIFVVWAIGVYNGLVSMRQRVNQAYDGPNNGDDDDGADDHGRSGHCKLLYSAAQPISSPRSMI